MAERRPEYHEDSRLITEGRVAPSIAGRGNSSSLILDVGSQPHLNSDTAKPIQVPMGRAQSLQGVHEDSVACSSSMENKGYGEPGYQS